MVFSRPAINEAGEDELGGLGAGARDNKATRSAAARSEVSFELRLGSKSTRSWQDGIGEPLYA